MHQYSDVFNYMTDSIFTFFITCLWWWDRVTNYIPKMLLHFTALHLPDGWLIMLKIRIPHWMRRCYSSGEFKSKMTCFQWFSRWCGTECNAADIVSFNWWQLSGADNWIELDTSVRGYPYIKLINLISTRFTYNQSYPSDELSTWAEQSQDLMLRSTMPDEISLLRLFDFIYWRMLI